MSLPCHDDGLPTFAELRARGGYPAPSTWGLWGDDDDVGALHLLGAAEVRRGIACADAPRGVLVGPPNRRVASPFRPHATHTIIDLGRGWRDDYLDGFYLQQTSQIDGLRHVAHHEHGLYNGVDAARIVAGDPVLGVGVWADRGVVGRGVLVDVAAYREQLGQPLDHAAGEPIDVALLEATIAAENLRLMRGDLLCVRTGYLEYRRANPNKRGHAGIEQSWDMLEWLWDNRIPLVAADNVAVEAVPPVASSPFVRSGAVDSDDALMHAHLIALMGMVVGELWALDALAADCAIDGNYDFLLVVKPLALTGGVGSTANATAIK